MREQSNSFFRISIFFNSCTKVTIIRAWYVHIVSPFVPLRQVHWYWQPAPMRDWVHYSPLIAELKALTRDQDSLIQSQTRLVNQLTACLKAYYPAALKLFAKLHQRSTLLFLQTFPTPQQAQAASIEHLTQTLKQAGHTSVEKVAPKIYQTVHQQHLVANAVTTRTKSRLMQALVAQLLPVIEQIAELFLRHEDNAVFSSLPGAGKRLAPRILAEWGDDRVRYADVERVAALAGTSPVSFESGTYASVHQRFACIKPLRNALHQFARQSTQQEAWAKDYYERKRKEGKSHSMAVRALANIWVRILFAMWHKRELYRQATFLAAQRQHASRAA